MYVYICIWCIAYFANIKAWDGIIWLYIFLLTDILPPTSCVLSGPVTPPSFTRARGKLTFATTSFELWYYFISGKTPCWFQ